jgi:transposase
LASVNGGDVMAERPDACPACRGTVLIRSGRACGRQRWRCKSADCGRQFTRTTPRGKPAELKRHAIELYCLGLSMNAVAKRVGVSAQSMLRWVRDHAQRHCPKPEPTASTAVVEIDEVWHFVKKSPRNSGSGRPSSAARAG